MISKERLADLNSKTLTKGSHSSASKGLCVMESVAWLAQENHSDRPKCVCPVIATFCRAWNDALPNDESRTRLLLPLVPLMVGTKSTPEVVQQRGWMVVDWEMRTRLPAFLRLLPATQPHAARLTALAPIGSVEALEAATVIAQEAAKEADAARAAARAAAWDAARAAAWDAAWAAAWDAARAAAWAAAWDAARAAAWDAAWDAARDAARDAAWDAAWAAARDAARAAAWDAAKDFLAPTVAECQASAVELVKRLCAVGREGTAS